MDRVTKGSFQRFEVRKYEKNIRLGSRGEVHDKEVPILTFK
jgi:hypothetical protein